MSKNLAVFDFNSNQVRVVTQDGEPWFVAKDLCAVLGIKNIRQNLAKLDNDEKSSVCLNDGTPGNPNTAIVSESGMYALVLSSRKPEAKPFRKWVTSEVLPAIRKTGSYSLPRQPQPIAPLPPAPEYEGIIKLLPTISDPIIKSALTQRIAEELSGTNQEDCDRPVLVAVVARQMGYPCTPPLDGILGKYVAARLTPAGKTQHGKYAVNVYQDSGDLRGVIRDFFTM